MKTLNYYKTVIAIVLLTSGAAQAQIAIGGKLGLNSSTQAELGQLYYNNEFLLGTQAGIQIDYRFHPILSVQVEGNYISKGSKHDLDGTYENNDVSRKLNYVNIPVLLKTRFGSELGLNEKYKMFLYAGPYYSKLISATDYADSEDISEISDIENEAKESDLGLSFGGGFSYVLKNKNELFFDIRYDMGLAEVVTSDNDIRNKTIGFSVGYCFF